MLKRKLLRSNFDADEAIVGFFRLRMRSGAPVAISELLTTLSCRLHAQQIQEIFVSIIARSSLEPQKAWTEWVPDGYGWSGGGKPYLVRPRTEGSTSTWLKLLLCLTERG
jgi:hypothetical protein